MARKPLNDTDAKLLNHPQYNVRRPPGRPPRKAPEPVGTGLRHARTAFNVTVKQWERFVVYNPVANKWVTVDKAGLSMVRQGLAYVVQHLQQALSDIDTRIEGRPAIKAVPAGRKRRSAS